MIKSQVYVCFGDIGEEHVRFVDDVTQRRRLRLSVATDFARRGGNGVARVTHRVLREGGVDHERLSARYRDFKPPRFISFVLLRLAVAVDFADLDDRLKKPTRRRSRGPVFGKQYGAAHDDARHVVEVLHHGGAMPYFDVRDVHAGRCRKVPIAVASLFRIGRLDVVHDVVSTLRRAQFGILARRHHPSVEIVL